MASVRNVIELQDKMTAQLKKISKELESTRKIMKEVNDQTDNLFDGSGKAVNDAVKDFEKFNNELDNTKKKTKEVENSMDKMNDAFAVFQGTFLGNLAYDAFSGILQGIKNTVTGAITYASDLAEIQNVVDVTFKENAKTIDAWSQTTLDKFGLNTLSAKNYASTLGAMMKSSGLTAEQTLNMSMALTQLTGDVASFRNLKPDEVFYKMMSVVTGETEPLKQLGVNMVEVNMDAYAMSKGIETSYREMSQAEKVVLRYNYVMEQLSDAQGDFTRTQGSFSNQAKLLQENWNSFAGNIANNVVPILALLLQGLNGVISFLADHTDMVVTALTTIAIILALVGAKALWAGAASLKAGIQAAIAWLGALWPVVLIIAAIGLLIMVLNAFGVETSQVIAFVISAFVGFGVLVGNIFILLFNTILTFANFLANIFTNPIGAVKLLFYDLAITVIGYIRDIAQSIEDLLNSIPTVEVDITSGLDSMYKSLKKGRKELVEKEGLNAADPLEYLDTSSITSSTYDKTYSDLKDIGSWFGGLNDITGSLPNMDNLYGGFGDADLGTLGQGNDIDKVGEVGKIKDDVSITDEDIELLKDVAKVDYVNKFTTMNPQVNVTFGDVKETADVNEITKVISEMVKEAVATSLV